VGIIDSYDKLMHSCFREGTKSESDIKAIHNFMDLAPRLTMNELGKTKPSLGSISSVLVRSDKGVFVFSRLDEFIIVVGLDVEIPTPVPELVARLIKSAASRSPDLPSPSETVEAATVENSHQDA
jgi:nucleoside-specific outer membrane channel protein Tsx